jgi:hypothetical protein
MNATDHEALFNSHWRTHELAAWALTWNTYGGNGGPTGPIWRGISSTEEGAKAFYNSIDDQDELRDMAVEALVTSGWTLGRINFRKS